MKKIIYIKDGNFYLIVSDNGTKHPYTLRLIPKNLDKIIPEEELYENDILTAPKTEEINEIIEQWLWCEQMNKFPPKQEEMKKIVKIFEKYGYKHE